MYECACCRARLLHVIELLVGCEVSSPFFIRIYVFDLFSCLSNDSFDGLSSVVGVK